MDEQCTFHYVVNKHHTKCYLEHKMWYRKMCCRSAKPSLLEWTLFRKTKQNLNLP